MNPSNCLVCGAVLAALVACAPAMAAVTVSGAWVRGTVEGQPATAAYMTIHSDSGARLVSVSSPVATRCSVHRMSSSGNVMRMRTLESLEIPAGGSVELREGGDHLMLEGLTHALKGADMVALTLTFVEAGGRRQTLEVRAPVLPLGAPGGLQRKIPAPPTTR
jgi:hypothetical protein